MNWINNGLVVAVIFTLGVLFIRRLPKYRWLAAAVLLAGITPLVTAGFWFSTGQLGISDWDYYFSLHHTHRQTILQYHQLPFWNPYICGGTAGVADPEFRFFTPTFLLQLVFGIPVGFRLSIWLPTATGAIGMLMLGKRLGLSVEASLLAAIAASFGTVNLLEVVEGHANIFAVMYIPWIFLSWLTAYRSKSKLWTIVTGVLLAFTFFDGGIYLLMYTSLAFAALFLLTKNHWRSLQISFVSGCWALGLAAIKLIPVALWLRQFPDQAYASSAYTLPYLNYIFLGRLLHDAGDVIPNQGSAWHEYGAYIGPFVLVLAILGLIVRRRNRIVRALAIAAVLATLLSATGPMLKPILDHAPFFPRSNISRVILFAVIPLSLLAGFGLDSLPKKSFVIILLLVAADLFSLAYPLSEQAFVLPRVTDYIPPAPSPIAYTLFDYKTRHAGADYTRAYEATIRGYGTFSYCSVLGPQHARGEQPAVRTIHDEGGSVLIATQSDQGKGSFQLLNWTPNEVRARVSMPGPGTVSLNTNYVPGWVVNGQPAKEAAGRVATTFDQAGEYTVVFRYLAPGFALGASISLITVALASTFLVREFYIRRRRVAEPG